MEDNLQYIDSSFYDTETTHDPIWGSIKISEFEKRLINTPEFQRLRRIKQLGFVNLVYAAAEHSRFVHSIGVCHHSKKLLYQVNENFKNTKRYRIWRSKGINGGSNPPEYKDVKITYSEKIVISAAALLHDLPHAPFSHEIESPNDSPKTGIPNHDNFDKNPVFFKYLFDKEQSRLAQVICAYNHEFWSLLQKDEEWINAIKNKYDKEFSSIFSDDGYVLINEKSIINAGSDAKFLKLPVLGVMIFELHLFEKPEDWVKYDSKKNKFSVADPKAVETEWAVAINGDDDENSDEETDAANQKDTALYWSPINGWFRPYRKDIVGNTICADLIDYIERDGRQTGIISSIDLKFLDRMTISKAYPEKDKATELKILWENIPEHCEHVVFDIYDHKRGFIRESVITEILSCLQARYQLTERVYNHRVVEGARSMLQEISKLLCSVGVLNVKLLHTGVTEDNDDANCPLGDDTFLAWVMDVKQRLKGSEDNLEKRDKILAAAKLARALKERRIYREAVIIDGIHGYITGSSAGGESNCKALENVLLSDDKDIVKSRGEMLNSISKILREAYKKTFNAEIDEFQQLATIGARKVGKKYKIPRVLVAKPYSNDSDQNPKIDIQPLFACEDPPHIKIQLDAMKTAYNSLWRVYLFIHPAFHWNRNIDKHKSYIKLHEDIGEIFLNFTKEKTPITWKNSINYKKLLPDVPIDYVEFIEHYEPKSIQIEVSELSATEEANMTLIIEDFTKEVFSHVPNSDKVLKKFNEGHNLSLLKLVSKDKQVINYLLKDDKRDVLIEKLPKIYIDRYANRTPNKMDVSDILFKLIKIVITDNEGFFNNL